MPCLARIYPATGKSTHTNRHCKWVNDLKSDPEAGYKRIRKPRPRGKGGKGKKEPEAAGEDMDEDDTAQDAEEGTAAKSGNPWAKKTAGAYHTFLSTPTVRQKKSAFRTLNATLPAVSQYVKWSENPCVFERSDHPAIILKSATLW